jgi:hypothetical protein
MPKIVENWLGYPKGSHPINVAAWFYMRLDRWPTRILYPPDSTVTCTPEESKKLRSWGIKVGTDVRAKQLVLAGPIHVE